MVTNFNWTFIYKQAEMAHSVLNKMIDFHKMTGMKNMKPNEITYNTGEKYNVMVFECRS